MSLPKSFCKANKSAYEIIHRRRSMNEASTPGGSPHRIKRDSLQSALKLSFRRDTSLLCATHVMVSLAITASNVALLGD